MHTSRPPIRPSVERVVVESWVRRRRRRRTGWLSW
jgi:hypothetical protein